MEQLTGSTYTIGEAGDEPRRLLLVGNSGSREDPVMYSLSYQSLLQQLARTGDMMFK